MKTIVENVNLLLVVVGFIAWEVGLAWQWSGAVALLGGGLQLMLIGVWPYLVRTLRKGRA